MCAKAEQPVCRRHVLPRARARRLEDWVKDHWRWVTEEAPTQEQVVGKAGAEREIEGLTVGNLRGALTALGKTWPASKPTGRQIGKIIAVLGKFHQRLEAIETAQAAMWLQLRGDKDCPGQQELPLRTPTPPAGDGDPARAVARAAAVGPDAIM